MPDPTNPSGLIVGIDIGGTKTQIRALGPGGYRRERVLLSTEWRRRHWREDAQRLLVLSRELVGTARVEALGVGAHGCDDTEECATFQRAFEAEAPIPVAVVNDAELMPLAVSLPGQIGVVAGTGSIAVHRSPENQLLVAGGWGWIIGDEGSAAGLVREAVKAVALHLDRGGNADDPLVEAIFSTLGAPNAARLGSLLGGLSTAAAVGRHAAAVFQAADLGSALARRVICDGGRALADLVVRLRSRGVMASHVIVGGGVIVTRPFLWQAFAESLGIGTTRALVPILFAGEPVEGAMNLAEATLVHAARRTRHQSFPLP